MHLIRNKPIEITYIETVFADRNWELLIGHSVQTKIFVICPEIPGEHIVCSVEYRASNSKHIWASQVWLRSQIWRKISKRITTIWIRSSVAFENFVPEFSSCITSCLKMSWRTVDFIIWMPRLFFHDLSGHLRYSSQKWSFIKDVRFLSFYYFQHSWTHLVWIISSKSLINKRRKSLWLANELHALFPVIWNPFLRRSPTYLVQSHLWMWHSKQHTDSTKDFILKSNIFDWFSWWNQKYFRWQFTCKLFNQCFDEIAHASHSPKIKSNEPHQNLIDKPVTMTR
jgi:hypothetical protein